MLRKVAFIEYMRLDEKTRKTTPFKPLYRAMKRHYMTLNTVNRTLLLKGELKYV
jgi:hypothetical protein